MELFLQQVMAGLASGSIYASLGLAIVMVHQATHHVNFAQGEMAMFSTFIAWSLVVNHGVNYWLAFVITLMISFIGATAIERVVFMPVRKAPVLTHLIIFIGLFEIFHNTAGEIFGHMNQTFPSPFPAGSFAGLVGIHAIGSIGVIGLMLIIIYAFFRFTRLGLAMRAAAFLPEAARLVGIRVNWMTALGWGLAASFGFVSGAMVAPMISLDASMMGSVLVYSFAASILGGIDSPGGAVVGGFIMGVLENMVGTYIDFIGSELKTPFALVILIVTLLLKPNGLFGRKIVTRV